MPLPGAPSLERVWLDALRLHLTQETGIEWANNPKPPQITDTPTAGLWVVNDFAPDRPNMLDDLTRDQLMGVVWQVQGDRATAEDLATDWKNYLVTVFNDIRRGGIVAGGNPGAFAGIKSFGVTTDGGSVFCKNTSNVVSAESEKNSAIVLQRLEFRYVYKLPARIC